MSSSATAPVHSLRCTNSGASAAEAAQAGDAVAVDSMSCNRRAAGAGIVWPSGHGALVNCASELRQNGTKAVLRLFLQQPRLVN